MSWAETKKINGNLSKSLDTLITEKMTDISDKIKLVYVDIYRTSTTADFRVITISDIEGYAYVYSNDAGSPVYLQSFDPYTTNIAVTGMSAGDTIVVIPTLIPLVKNKSYSFFGNSYGRIVVFRYYKSR